MLEAGTKAPLFSLPDKDGNIVRLSDYIGNKVVVYFYPRDNTSGCTKQACAFRNVMGDYDELGVKVIGISKDNQKSHKNFTDKNELNFTILSDTELEAIKAYDVWQEKKLYGKVSMGVVRTTYVIDEEGKIAKVYPKAKPDTNAAEILSWIKENNG